LLAELGPVQLRQRRHLLFEAHDHAATAAPMR
jgi:hypothetical protein